MPAAEISCDPSTALIPSEEILGHTNVAAVTGGFVSPLAEALQSRNAEGF